MSSLVRIMANLREMQLSRGMQILVTTHGSIINLSMRRPENMVISLYSMPGDQMVQLIAINKHGRVMNMMPFQIGKSTIKRFAVNAIVEVAGLDLENDDAVAVVLVMPKAKAKDFIGFVTARNTPLMAQLGGPQDFFYEADQLHIR